MKPAAQREFVRIMDDTPPPDLKTTLATVAVDDILCTIMDWQFDRVKQLSDGLTTILEEMIGQKAA
jgi:hypothetical protein